MPGEGSTARVKSTEGQLGGQGPPLGPSGEPGSFLPLLTFSLSKKCAFLSAPCQACSEDSDPYRRGHRGWGRLTPSRKGHLGTRVLPGRVNGLCADQLMV